MSNKKLEIDQNGYLKFNNKIVKPKFSIKKTEILHKKKIKNFIKSKFYSKTIIDGYHTINHVMPFLFWGYCFLYYTSIYQILF